MKAAHLVLLSIAMFTALLGCFSHVGVKRFDEIMMGKVRTKAAFDLECSKDDLQVQKVDNGVYGATGCGKRATYVGQETQICNHQNTEENLVDYCKVVPDAMARSEGE